jgi:hypothetical protein
MKKITFKVTQQDNTVLIYKPNQEFDFYSVAHFDPHTDSTRLIKQITNQEALRLFEQYKSQNGIKVTIV